MEETIISNNDRIEILEMHDNGFSVSFISKKFNVSKSIIYNIIEEIDDGIKTEGISELAYKKQLEALNYQRKAAIAMRTAQKLLSFGGENKNMESSLRPEKMESSLRPENKKLVESSVNVLVPSNISTICKSKINTIENTKLKTYIEYCIDRAIRHNLPDDMCIYTFSDKTMCSNKHTNESKWCKDHKNFNIFEG